MIVEQTYAYLMRMIYHPETGEFAESEYRSLFHEREFPYPYGWIEGSGTPPAPHWDCLLLSEGEFALGDRVEIKVVGVFSAAMATISIWRSRKRVRSPTMRS